MKKLRKTLSLLLVFAMVFTGPLPMGSYATAPDPIQFTATLDQNPFEGDGPHFSFTKNDAPIALEALIAGDSIKVFVEGIKNGNAYKAIIESWNVTSGMNTINLTSSNFTLMPINDSVSDDLTITGLTIMKGASKFDFGLSSGASIYFKTDTYEGLAVHAQDATYNYSFFRDLSTSGLSDGITLDKASFQTEILPTAINTDDQFKLPQLVSIGSNHLSLFRAALNSNNQATNLNVEIGNPGVSAGSIVLDGASFSNVVPSEATGNQKIRFFGSLLGGIDIFKNVDLNSSLPPEQQINSKISYNTAGYFSLTTDVVNAIQSNNIDINISQGLLSGFMSNMMEINKPAVQLVKVVDGNEVNIPLQSNACNIKIQNPQNPYEGKFNLSVTSNDLFTLADNTEYRLYIFSPFVRTMLSKLKDNLFVLQNQEKNMRGRFSLATGGEPTNQVEFANSYYTVGNVAETPSTVKQLTSDSTLYASDKTVKFTVGTTSPIGTLSYIIETTENLVIPTAKFKVNGIDYSNIEPVTTTSAGAIKLYTFSVPINNTLPANFDVQITAMNTAEASTLASLLRESTNQRLTYIYNKTSEGSLVNFAQLRFSNEFMIIDPLFDMSLSEQTANITLNKSNPLNYILKGRLVEDTQGYHPANFMINFSQTGITNRPKIALSGTSTSTGKADIPFYLTLNNNGNGNYSSNFQFIDQSDPNRIIPPGNFDPNTYGQSESDVGFYQIPLYVAEKNHVKLNYTINQVEYKIEFDYYPNSKFDIGSWLNFQNTRVSNNSTQITVMADAFNTDSGASLELSYLNQSNAVTTVAVFDHIKSITPVTVQEPNGEYRQKKLVTFEIQNTQVGYNQITTILNNIQLLGKIVINKAYPNSTPLTGELSISGSAFVDVMPPNLNVYFKDSKIINGIEYYSFAINLGDEISTTELTLSDISFIDKLNNPINIANILLEPLFDEFQQDTSVAHEYVLRIPKTAHRSDLLVKVQSLQDLAGNTSGITLQPLEIRKEVSIYVRNHQFNPIEGKAAWLYPISLEPKDNGYSLPQDKEYQLHGDEPGMVKGQLPLGQYRLYGFGDPSNPDSKTPLDEIITISGSGEEQVQQIEIQLHEPNVIGQVVRTNPNLMYSENLVFAETSVFQDFTTLKTEMENTVDETQREALRKKMDVIQRIYFINVKTDNTGAFKVYLNPSKSYKLVGRKLGFNITPLNPPINIDFSTQPVVLSINLPQPDMLLHINKTGNLPILNAFVQLSIGNQFFGQETNTEGIIPLFITSGASVKIESIAIRPRMGNADSALFLFKTKPTFTKTQGVSEVTYTLDKTPNVLLYPAVNGEKAYISAPFNAVINNNWIESHGGIIKLYLESFESTTYQLTSATLNGINLVESNNPKTINKTNMPLDITNMVNMKINLKDDQNMPMPDRNLNINVDFMGFESRTNASGNAYFMIDSQVLSNKANVEVRYNGFSYNNLWVNFNDMHEQVPVSAFATRYDKSIVIVAPNFRGTVEENNTPLITNGWMSIEKVSMPSKWFGAPIGETGNFDLVIDEPGDYIVRSVGNPNKKYDINFAFTINNALVAVDANGTPIPMPVKIGKVQPNLFGYVKTQSNGTYTGEHVSLLIKEVQSDGNDFPVYATYPWLYERWIDVDKTTGYFETTVKTGTYKAVAVSTEKSYLQFASPINLTLAAENTVKPPYFTFQGAANNYDNSAIARGHVSITNMSETSWSGMEISNGYFGKNLVPGETLKIKQINYELGATWYDFNINKSVTVDNSNSNIDLIIQPNVKGILTGITELANSEWSSVRIHPVLTAQDLSTADYQRYQTRPWEFDIWSKIINDSNEYVFYTQLPQGNYVLSEIQFSKNNIMVNKPFTLGAASSGIVTKNGDKYLLEYGFAPNVTGQILENSQPVANAWINIVEVDSNGNRLAWMGAKSNASGNFKFSLKPGKYILEGYHIEGTMVDGVWNEGAWTRVDYKFELLDENDTEIINLSPNLTGSIQLADGTPLKNAWVDIRKVVNNVTDWTQGYWYNTTKDSNTFKASLPNGSYKVVGMGSDNVWFGGDDLNIGFTINNDNVQVLVKPLTQNFAGIAYLDNAQTDALDWGWIRIRPANTKFDDWDKKRHIETNGTGLFSAALADGNYVIEEYGNYREFRRVELPINVAGSTITGLSTANGKYVLKPPAANFSGIVKDKTGNSYQNRAWLAIKPVTADEYDWSNVIWVEYRDYKGTYKFEATLPTGNYRLFSVFSYDFEYKPDMTLTVPGSNLDIVVSAPTPNFSGTVYEGANNASALMVNGWLNVIRVDANGNQVRLDGTAIPEQEKPYNPMDIAWQYSIGTPINDQGHFEMLLKNGETYEVVAVGNYNTWYRSGYAFTAGNSSTGLQITKPSDNVSITFVNTPSFLAGQGFAWISLYSSSGNDQYHYETKFVSGSEYAFTSTLKPGTYTIGFIETASGHFELDKQIQVTAGQNNITVNFADYASTVVVKGTLTINSAAVTDATVFAVQGTVDSQVKKIKVTTAADGQFTVVLPENTTWSIVEMANKDGYRTLSGQTNFSTTEVDINGQAINITY